VLLVCFQDPTSLSRGGGLEDVSLVEKYMLTDDQCVTSMCASVWLLWLGFTWIRLLLFCLSQVRQNGKHCARLQAQQAQGGPNVRFNVIAHGMKGWRCSTFDVVPCVDAVTSSRSCLVPLVARRWMWSQKPALQARMCVSRQCHTPCQHVCRVLLVPLPFPLLAAWSTCCDVRRVCVLGCGRSVIAAS